MRTILKFWFYAKHSFSFQVAFIFALSPSLSVCVCYAGVQADEWMVARAMCLYLHYSPFSKKLSARSSVCVCGWKIFDMQTFLFLNLFLVLRSHSVFATSSTGYPFFCVRHQICLFHFLIVFYLSQVFAFVANATTSTFTLHLLLLLHSIFCSSYEII